MAQLVTPEVLDLTQYHLKLNVVTHTCNSNTLEMEEGRS